MYNVITLSVCSFNKTAFSNDSFSCFLNTFLCVDGNRTFSSLATYCDCALYRSASTFGQRHIHMLARTALDCQTVN